MSGFGFAQPPVENQTPLGLPFVRGEEEDWYGKDC
jgi:hypothetical protein